MRIVIDMQGAQTGSRFRGIGRYTISLAKAIVHNSGDHEVVIALSGLFPDTIESIRGELNNEIPQNKIVVWDAPGPVSEIDSANIWRRKSAELIRESFLKMLEPDIILITSFFEGYGDSFVCSVSEFDHETLTVGIFYDLIPYIYKKIYLADKDVARWYNDKLEQCKKVNLLLSISESSRNEAIEYLGIKPGSIVNISTASDEKFRVVDLQNNNTNIFNEFKINRPFLMYASATDWRKNHLRLIEAYSRLPFAIREQHQLVIVGGLPDDHRIRFEKYAKKCGLSNNEFIVTGIVTDEEMNALYNKCKAFVFPSWHEGFGLPVLEAMQCGKAVIGSNKSSVPEVIGREDALFDPFDVKNMTEKIVEVLTKDELRSSLEQHSLRQSKKFSWDITSRRAIDAIEKLVYNREDRTMAPCQVDNNDIVSELITRISSIDAPFLKEDLIATANAIAKNFCSLSNQQILVDVSELVQHDAGSGIQRVVRNILLNWLSNPPDGVQIKPVYASVDKCYRYANNFLGKSEPVDDEPIEFKSGDIFIGMDLIHPDIIISHENFYKYMRNHGVQVKFVVYDLIPVKFPQYCNEGVHAGYLKWLEIVCHGDGVVCISKAVADEFKIWLKARGIESQRPFSVDWFHLGADINNTYPVKGVPDDAAIKLDQLGNRSSFLMVGTLEPRKAHEQVLRAFEQLWDNGQDVNLVMVGGQGWLVESLVGKLRKHQELDKRLFWFEGISDEYLRKIYSACTCLIAASYGEGFGLPLIEAAQHKLPVIARDIPVFREVAGEYAYYFADEKDPAIISQNILNWINLYKKNKHPQSEAMPWLTWKESAQQLKEIILPV